jgi:hypothetical protein
MLAGQFAKLEFAQCGRQVRVINRPVGAAGGEFHVHLDRRSHGSANLARVTSRLAAGGCVVFASSCASDSFASQDCPTDLSSEFRPRRLRKIVSLIFGIARFQVLQSSIGSLATSQNEAALHLTAECLETGSRGD